MKGREEEFSVATLIKEGHIIPESEEDALRIAEADEIYLGEVCRKELAWAESAYEEDPMDPWINGYRTALRTVLRKANKVRSEEK